MKANRKANRTDFLDYVVEVVRLGYKLTKDDMQFAYVVFYCNVGESVEQSVKSVLMLNEFKY